MFLPAEFCLSAVFPLKSPPGLFSIASGAPPKEVFFSGPKGGVYSLPHPPRTQGTDPSGEPFPVPFSHKNCSVTHFFQYANDAVCLGQRGRHPLACPAWLNSLPGHRISGLVRSADPNPRLPSRRCQHICGTERCLGQGGEEVGWRGLPPPGARAWEGPHHTVD